MSKEYRDMTSEERLSIINAAMKKDGFAELKNIIDEFDKVLVKNEALSVSMIDNPVHITDENVEPIREIINNEGLAGFTNVQNDNNDSFERTQYNVSGNIDLSHGSIYAAEHREEAMAENGIIPMVKREEIEQPRVRVLSSAPNPWGDAEIVTPGQLKL